MKLNYADILRKCQFPLLLAAGTLPLTLALLYYLAPKALPWTWILVCLFLAGSLITLLTPGKLRVWVGIIPAALMLGLGIWQIFLSGYIFTVVPAVLYAGLLVFAIFYAGWEWTEELPSICLGTCLGIHLLGQTLQFFVLAFGFPLPESVTVWFNISFFVFVFLAMLAINRKTQIQAALSRRKPTASVRRKNTAFVVIFFFAVLLIALTPSIITAVKDFIKWFIEWLHSLFFTSGEVVQTRPPTDPIETDGTDFREEIERKPLPKWLDNLQAFLMLFFRHAGLPVTVIGLTVLVVLLIRPIGRLLMRLFAAVRSGPNLADDDFEDEVTSTNEDKEKKTSKEKQSAPIFFWDWQKLPPRERIRWRYKQLQKKHSNWHRSSTARENLPDTVSPYYEQARYSDREITEEDAKQFTSGTRRI